MNKNFLLKTYKYDILFTNSNYGGVAQLARAIGSYPIGREFKPLRRYQNSSRKVPAGAFYYRKEEFIWNQKKK